MTELADYKNCTGCTACFNTCAHDAIQMQENEEGFRYPHIDASKCVDCGLCAKRCPELNKPATRSVKQPKVYALINKRDVTHSSSGGAFSAIARWIINLGGIVYGATMDENGYVYHVAIETETGLNKIQGSKYVQSDLREIFGEIKQHISSRRKVLFVGTGCQVAGLYSFLNKRYDDILFTIDLVCHGTPSNKAFLAYVDKLKSKIDCEDAKLEYFAFRKLDGWSYCPSIKLTNTKRRYLELSENAFMSSFFKGILFRESCYNCSYCNIYREGTFTLADFWGIGKHGTPFNKDISHGVSLLIDNCGLLKSLVLPEVYIEERDLSEAIADQDNLKNPIPRDSNRDFAVKMLIAPSINLDVYCNKVGIFNKKTLSWKVFTYIKHFLLNVGLFNLYKKIQYKYFS